jgi:hypothetical protein
MTKSTEHCRELASMRETVSLLVNKMSEEGMWDSLKAKDVPEEIISHVLTELELGKDPGTVRREMGIKSQTSKEWQKIAAAIKGGHRVNTPMYFHRLMTRQERMAGKLEKVINFVLDQDVEQIQDTTDSKGEPIFRGWVKDISGMVDSYNRLTQGIIKNGKDLGVFADGGGDGKGSGTTIIVKSNITLKAPEKKEPKTVEAQVVSKKELPKP